MITLIDNAHDLADLWEIKDIKEELMMMSALFHSQKDVAGSMHLFFADERESSLYSQREADASSERSKQGYGDDIAKQKMHSSLLTAIRKSLDQLAQLEKPIDPVVKNVSKPNPPIIPISCLTESF